MIKSLILLVFVLVMMAASATAQVEDYHSVSPKELQLLVGDLAKSNPDVIKRIAADPSLKIRQLDKLKELLAYACQAQRDGLADDPVTKQELANIKAEVISTQYDKKINEGKPAKPPFAYITDEQVKVFWSQDAAAAKEADFQKFLSAKVELLRRGDPQMASYTPTDDEKNVARDIYARSRIYEKDYQDKAKNGALDAEFQQRTNLQVKLQHAQFLAQLYVEKSVKFDPTDDEIKTYLSQHPELDPQPKKLKAQGILQRAKAGEDFAALANQYTDDPGNKNDKGELQGGLYRNVPVGTMVEVFEKAALALQPGQISPDLVESDFGYHIIKLEKKADSKNADGKTTQIYDVRHILISTMHNDDPGSGPKPLKQYVQQKLMDEKQKNLVNELVTANKVSVPSDYTLPTPAEKKPTPKPTAKSSTPVRKKPRGKR